MKRISIRAASIVSVLFVAGMTLAAAQNASTGVSPPANSATVAVEPGSAPDFVAPRWVLQSYSTSLKGERGQTKTMAILESDASDRSPQAVAATAQPPAQLTPCPEPVRLFALSEYKGPGKGLLSKKPVVQRGLDGRPCGLSVGEKFSIFARSTISPKTYATAAWNAGIAQAEDNDPEWGQGAEGYGKRYAAAYTDSIVRNFFRKFAFPSIFSQDPRYYRSEKSGGGARFGHALAHTFVTRSDEGYDSINYSQLLGTSAAVAIGNLYHPGHKRGFKPAAERFGTHIGYDMGFDVLREFWPEIVRKLHLPFKLH
ncbi:MAG: hypothetical protein ACM3SW_02700 [Actinomycetota bacterium]